MKTTIKIFFGTLILILSFGELKAQDIHFSQMQYSPLTLNPAQAGALYNMQAVVNYRSQWKSAAFPYSTFAGSYDMRVYQSKTGFFAGGINFFHDVAGDIKMTTLNFNFSLAYHLNIDDKSTLGLGLQGGFGQRGIKSPDGQWGNQFVGLEYDPSILSGESFANTSILHGDVGTGLVYTYKKNEGYMTSNDLLWINAGFATYHVNRPYSSFLKLDNERLPIRWSAFYNMFIGIQNSNVVISPSIFYNRQGPAQELLGGTYVKYILKEGSKITSFEEGTAFSLGVFYRFRDAIIPKMMVEYSNYSVGISYDINISSFARSTNGRGGIEFFLRAVFDGNTSKDGFVKPSF